MQFLNFLIRFKPSKTANLFFQLVLTDLRMPNGTGLDCFSAVKSINSEIPVIVMTALPD